MAYIGNTVENQGFTPAIDYFNGNGVTVTFTLSRPIASVAQVIVAIDNVIQNPSSSFTIAGNAITFSSAPLSGTNNIWVEYTSLITTYQAISQDPTVIGDIRATGGYLAEGDFGNSFVDGVILDYVTGLGRITVGSAEGIALYNGGTASRTALMTVAATGNVGIGTTSPATKLQVAGDTKIGVTGTNGVLQLARSSDGATITNFLTDGTSGIINSAVSTTFQINTAEAMRITSGGDVGINNTGLTGCRLGVSDDGSLRNAIGVNNTASGSGSQAFISFQRNTTQTGTISNTGSATAYNTSSDYRLKENISPMTNALATVTQLKPVTYTWKVDGSNGQGFIAHELQAVVPDCVTGEKDAVETYTDKDGNEQTRIKPQGVDTSFLVATLTSAIQELNAKVEAQAARIAALEAK